METFGLVLIEAMAAGLPVVTSRVGGVDDMVRPGVNGYVFNVGDVRGMIDGVRAILADPSKRQSWAATRACLPKRSPGR